jgi:outer membrane putative beta-barrel porin/alpha-amylase
LGVIFGYQWRTGSGSTQTTADASGISDLTIQPKIWLWQGLDDSLKFSTRVDMKLPTASKQHGLGTSNPDLGVLAIATYKDGKTNFDWNLGYYPVDISRTEFGDDHWFAGFAVRQELTKSGPSLPRPSRCFRTRERVAALILILVAARNGKSATTSFSPL